MEKYTLWKKVVEFFKKIDTAHILWKRKIPQTFPQSGLCGKLKTPVLL